MPYLPFIALIVFAGFFYGAAELEDEPAFIWSGLSVLVSALTIFWVHFGWIGIFGGQIALFAGITIFRIVRKK